MEKKSLKKNLDLIQSLPHRGVGTDNEDKAAKILEQEYISIGLKPEMQKFKIFKHNWIAYLIEFLLFAFSGISVLLGFEILSVIFLVLGSMSFFGFPIEIDNLYKFIFPGESQNVSVEINPKNSPKKTLVVVAHYDTGKVIVGAHVFGKFYDFFLGKEDLLTRKKSFEMKFMPRFVQTPAFLTDSIILAQIVAIVLFMLGSQLYLVFLVYSLFWSLAHVGFVSHVIISPFVPGALDNGIAVATTMSLADYFKNNPLESTRLVILNSGAEETRVANKGVSVFLENMKYDKDNTYFFNLEVLGSKHIVFTEGESDNRNGIHMCDKEALNFLEKFLQSTGYDGKSKFTYLPLCSDASALERGKAKVITTMLTMQDHGISSNYHTMHDTVNNVNIETATRAREILKNFVIEFDQNYKNA